MEDESQILNGYANYYRNDYTGFEEAKDAQQEVEEGDEEEPLDIDGSDIEDANEFITDIENISVLNVLNDSNEQLNILRCMDCDVFCQRNTGCPFGNIIPKWNDYVFKQNWRQALGQLL
ncbi:unnamed protein product [Onchocerca flexuosa]|uniref:Uncharacterized protein n=1 Tax=Onchocerca flexuosa TaxID=387005 RepID=A0A183H5I7_9BILA|nr:unnamed protein product [Onchocerca flexuosa]